MFAIAQPTPALPSSGARLMCTDGRELPLRDVSITADACAGRARVTLVQTFSNPHAEPLEVTYKVPLPADGAVSGYAFVFGDTRIVGEIDKKHRARARYEEALLTGHGAALLEQDRSSLFTQRIGNIPPGATVRCELTIDQPLIWRAGSWEWRFPTVVAPRYQSAPGVVPDTARQTVDVASGPLGVGCELSLNVRDTTTGPAESPSHTLGLRGRAVCLDGSAKLDRDVVVRWPVSLKQASVTLDLGRPEGMDCTYGALTIVPPQLPVNERPTGVARDLIVLLDTSGSMGGEPLNQAKRVVTALLEGLSITDQIELIEFSWRPSRWKRKPVAATPKNKRKAIAWLNGLSASGGTEMRDGILEALAPLRADAQRQVLLVTDGLIGFETDIIETICNRLPSSARVHTLGIGSGVNRTLTGGAARAGGGIELICAPGEDVAPMVAQLLARTEAPLVVDLCLSGSALREIAPARLPDLFAGAPAQLALALNPAGGELVVQGRTAAGPWQKILTVPPMDSGAGSRAVAALFGREQVEDLEVRIAGGERTLDPSIEAAGLRFGISTRLTSWIAVSAERVVDPTAATRSEAMPHALPYGMSAEGIGLRAAQAPVFGSPAAQLVPMPSFAAPPAPPAAPAPMMARSRPMVKKSKQMPARRVKSRDLADLGGGGAPPTRPTVGQPPPSESPVKGELESKIEVKIEAAYPDELDDAMDLEGQESVEVLAEREEIADPSPVVAVREVDGVLTVLGDRLVVEFSAEAHPWRAPTLVTLVFEDGTTIRLTVDAALTTRAGVLASGTKARLVLEGAKQLHGRLIARILIEDALVITL